jgi:uncharacterized protein YciI
MTLFHVVADASHDYLTRREPHRKAHLSRLETLRSQGTFVGGGPWPDAKGVDLVYRCADEAALKALVESDPYWGGGAWTGWRFKRLSALVEPKSLVPVVIDGSRPATVVEADTAAPSAADALRRLREEGRVHFAGVLADGGFWALAATAEAKTALSWLERAGLAGPLRARPVLYVL